MAAALVHGNSYLSSTWAASHFTPNILRTLFFFFALLAFALLLVFYCLMDQPLVIRLHPNAVIYERQDGVWFQSDSPVVFQNADINTMSELVEVFLYNLGGGFTEIRKVGYCFLQRQPNGRFVHLLVWLYNDNHVCVTFGCHRRLIPQHVMDFLVEVGGRPSGPPVAATPEGGECTANIPAAQCSRYILPVPPPIPRLEDVPCFFQQLDLDEGACVDPLKAGMGNDYNTDGGAELRLGHRMRNREAVQTIVKNYSIRRNAEYRAIESDRIKYHCRCKHADDGCP
ncbi:hypothetical protein PIB30_097595 [Stylosanthes scabra]|uniref:Uncharacterized protein n=1 Tax=Stylosanthes scabra TaxID=79078 RepID=A0ABU6VW33_9FABA|nr:hypothetical protein [Stylosanthes scabra]